MAVFRVQKTRDYTVMSNFHLKDKALSLKAKGLLSVMLSLPDEWDYSIDGLVAISKEGITSIKATLKELKECGYLRIIKERTSKGTYEYIYDIYEQPKTEKPWVENPPMDNPPVDNQLQLITKESNTKELITKDKYSLIPFAEIVDYLNKTCGTSFRASSKRTRGFIKARYEEGFNVDDFKKVIDTKAIEWLQNPDMCIYLRPETLFGVKFESYLNQKKTINKNGNAFNNFQQNNYTQEEMSELEKQLLDN